MYYVSLPLVTNSYSMLWMIQQKLNKMLEHIVSEKKRKLLKYIASLSEIVSLKQILQSHGISRLYLDNSSFMGNVASLNAPCDASQVR